LVDSSLRLVKITQWANALFREALKDNFDTWRSLETPYGTFGELCYHVFGAVYFWFRRTGHFDFNIKPVHELNREEFFSVWKMVDAEFVDLIARFDASDPDINVSYTTSKGKRFEIPAKDLVIQLYSHGYNHRAHIAYFTRLQGEKMPQTDALVYYRTME